MQFHGQSDRVFTNSSLTSCSWRQSINFGCFVDEFAHITEVFLVSWVSPRLERHCLSAIDRYELESCTCCTESG